jgi:hypothetical protein
MLFFWKICDKDLKKIITLTYTSCFTILILSQSNKKTLILTKALQGNFTSALLCQVKK